MTEAIELYTLQCSWKEATSNLDHSRVEKLIHSKEFDPSNIELRRENGHECMLACRLLVAEPHQSVGDVEVNAANEETAERLNLIENRLAKLEERLQKNQLSSLALFKEALKTKVAPVQPSILARNEAASNDKSDGEIWLTISVYSTQRPGIRTQTFDVAASSSLCELCDRLTCSSDRVVARMSKVGTRPIPHLPLPSEPAESNHTASPSSYFLIEGIFYSDLRSQEAKDLSSDIRNWIVSDHLRQTEIKGFQVMRPMNETRWLNIAIRIGRPYSFVHCGRCDHFIIIERIRREHLFDQVRTGAHLSSSPKEVDSTVLVRELFRLRRRRRRCRICDISRAAFITVNDRLAPENPCSFCETCYTALHYDGSGRLLYNDYRVYPYYHEL